MGGKSRDRREGQIDDTCMETRQNKLFPGTSVRTNSSSTVCTGRESSRKPIQVTFTIDMAPATSAATNPGTLFRPGVDTAYIQFDGCLAPVTQGKSMWGTDNQ